MPKQLDFTLTEAELTVLYTALKSDDADVVQRATALHSLHLGHPPEQVATVARVSLSTVYNYFHRFKAEGAAGLPDKPKPGRPPKADADYQARLVTLLDANPHDLGLGFAVWTLPRLAQYLTQVTGIELHPDRLSQLLSALGYVYRRPKHDLSAKQDPAAREQAREVLAEFKKMPPTGKLSYSIWTKAGSV